jgi:hypothetical protein
MAKLSVSDKGYAGFSCPGCGYHHRIRVKINGQALLPEPVWDWNGNEDLPTVMPSINFSATDSDGKDVRCHSFVKDGKIQFRGDCTHALVNQTVDLSDWED